MKNKTLIEVQIITLISVLLTIVVVVLEILFPITPIYWNYIFPFWTLSIIQSYAITIIFLRKYTFVSGFRIGVFLGTAFGACVLIIPIIAAPLLMVLYYINRYKKYKLLIITSKK
mgnify:CR=1 FL=1